MKRLSMAITGAVISSFCLGREAAQALHTVALPSELHEHSQTYKGAIQSKIYEGAIQDVLVVPPDAAGRPAYYASGNLYTFLASGEETGGQFALLDFLVSPLPSTDAVLPALHFHTREAESFYILEGDLTVFMESEDNSMVVPAGSFVYLPKGRPHAFTNRGTTPVRTLSLLTPAGFEEVFQEVGTLVTDKSVPVPAFTNEDLEKYLAIAPKYGICIISSSCEDVLLNALKGEELLDFFTVPPDASNRESISIGGGLYTSLATTEETGGEFALFNALLPPQAKFESLPINTQRQALYILDGELSLQVEDQTMVATSGTFVYLPDDEPYAFQNLGTTPVRTLVFATSPKPIPEPSSRLGLLGFGAFVGATLVLKRKIKTTNQPIFET
ncbi:cupin domain-containing protein [Scytonema sp. PCC 10023]|uniref:cupin domain-containing protein n=1 Tax=Scytonema sp. PCC 10023 TaxID=1680591 RepID=UPI0039C6D850